MKCALFTDGLVAYNFTLSATRAAVDFTFLQWIIDAVDSFITAGNEKSRFVVGADVGCFHAIFPHEIGTERNVLGCNADGLLIAFYKCTHGGTGFGFIDAVDTVQCNAFATDFIPAFNARCARFYAAGNAYAHIAFFTGSAADIGTGIFHVAVIQDGVTVKVSTIGFAIIVGCTG